MEVEEDGRRKAALKDVLYFLARLYGAFSNGMHEIKAVRFLNGTNELRVEDMVTRDQIEQAIASHKFEGPTRIGAGLMQKVLEPLVFSDEPWTEGWPRKLRQMERPLLIVIITSGVVILLPPSSLDLRIRVLSCIYE